MCDCDCGDPVDVFRESVHAARKTYRCEECGRTIQIGWQYHRIFWARDGDADEMKICARCERVREALEKENRCACYGDIRDVLDQRSYDRHGTRMALT